MTHLGLLIRLDFRTEGRRGFIPTMNKNVIERSPQEPSESQKRDSSSVTTEQRVTAAKSHERRAGLFFQSEREWLEYSSEIVAINNSNYSRGF